MLPGKVNEPAEYGKVERKVLDRPSTRHDLADFVTEFLYTDVSCISLPKNTG